jgi:hypothetical protein
MIIFPVPWRSCNVPSNSSKLLFIMSKSLLLWASKELKATSFRICDHNPNPFLTFCLTIFSYSALFSLHILAASTFAGLSSLGSASILMTLNKIFSTDCIGLHRSSAFSYPNWSSPGVWRIDMQTMPLGYTVTTLALSNFCH